MQSYLPFFPKTIHILVFYFLISFTKLNFSELSRGHLNSDILKEFWF